MGYVVKMPKLGLEMEEGTILDWYVEEEDTVEEGEAIAEIESEKTVAEIDAREGGVLRLLEVEEGATVPPGTPIGIIADADEDIADLESEFETENSLESTESQAATDDTIEESPKSAEEQVDTAGGGSTNIKSSPKAERRAEELGVDLAEVDGSGPQGAITADDVEAATDTQAESEQIRASPRAEQRAEELGVDLVEVSGSGPQSAITVDDVEAMDAEEEQVSDRIFAAPRVRQLAREHGLDINTLSGSGANGRITESDVRMAADESEITVGESETPETQSTGRTIREEKSFDGMRRTIANRLSQSYQNAVHVTEHREVDVEALLEAVEAASDALETDVSMPDLLLLAISASLSEHPDFNATFEDDLHRLYEEHNVCVAVDVEAGLITPVLREVNTKSIERIATERRELTEKALSGEYTMDDLQGGTFTVTNLGLLGVESFDPIINPPQVAILGVNAIQQRPVPDGEGVAFRRQLPLDLSFDHRVVDGADAARFLATLTEHIENPLPLLFDSL